MPYLWAFYHFSVPKNSSLILDFYVINTYQGETFIVDEHHVHVYASKNNNGTIIKAPRSVDMFRNSIATPSLVTSLINGKYVNAIPIKRQKRTFKDNGINLETNTMCNWIINAAERYLSLVYDRMHELIYDSQVTHNSVIGRALAYSINQEEYLRTFLNDGKIPMDNNYAEQAIKPFTIARKNFVLIESSQVANANAMIFSLSETAKANGLNTYQYFELLLTEIPKHLEDNNLNFLNDLMPWFKSYVQASIKNLIFSSFIYLYLNITEILGILISSTHV